MISIRSIDQPTTHEKKNDQKDKLKNERNVQKFRKYSNESSKHTAVIREKIIIKFQIQLKNNMCHGTGIVLQSCYTFVS